jgi:glycosyltransferase involved in cell wall biosynthesis
MVWHVLDVRAVWVKEFASALAEQVPALAWCPQITNGGMFRNREKETTLDDPCLPIRYFPLQRGFAKFPVMPIAREGERITQRLIRRTENPTASTLICTTPHYAPVAERWPGPVIYYVTDLFIAYGGADPGFIKSLDRRMCVAAALVCPNSRRIAEYLVEKAFCPASKIVVLPNATRKASLLTHSAQAFSETPPDIADLPRPMAGIIGNLSSNTDWVLLKETIARTPWLAWVFVGPTTMPINQPGQNHARDFLMQHGGTVRFVGPKPYGQLKDYARAFDVAILPYRGIEPTFSGSSTRFYEHLAACAPIIATRGFEELLHKEPLLRLVNTGEELADALEQLRQTDFRDGLEDRRWQASQSETWETRALSLRKALSERFGRGQEAA